MEEQTLPLNFSSNKTAFINADKEYAGIYSMSNAFCFRSLMLSEALVGQVLIIWWNKAGMISVKWKVGYIGVKTLRFYRLQE